MSAQLPVAASPLPPIAHWPFFTALLKPPRPARWLRHVVGCVQSSRSWAIHSGAFSNRAAHRPPQSGQCASMPSHPGVCRTDTWRYTEWATWNGTSLRPEWDKLVGAELYAHPAGHASTCDASVNGCFDEYENVNVLASEPAAAKAMSEKLHAVVASQWE